MSLRVRSTYRLLCQIRHCNQTQLYRIFPHYRESERVLFVQIENIRKFRENLNFKRLYIEKTVSADFRLFYTTK